MEFSERLQELRKTNGLSQEQLAEKCNVTRQAVSKWESGLGYPEMEKVIQLCDILKVDLDYLMRGKLTSTKNETLKENMSVYKSFEGKWVKIYLNDREFQGIYRAAVVAVNSNYIIFEQKSKKGVLKTSDIRSISNLSIMPKRPESAETIVTREFSENCNPYEGFEGKICHIRLKCNSLFTSFQGYYDAEISSVSEDGIIIIQKGKETAVKTSDILMIIEN
ncbi:DNA-binding helix-turn-helix protein [Clostridiales bacterium oral taxon 876 str. F0540]|nr:DNA-binding helix-turn-helix protein [Clostridiales bacterium oral taxon 876 str. F0540]